MVRPVYETTVGAKVLFGWSGTELLPIFVDFDGQIVITSDDPTSKYKITDIDPTEGNSYFGYVDKNGAWYIMNLTATAARYAKGNDNYTGAWGNKGGQNWGYFNDIF